MLLPKHCYVIDKRMPDDIQWLVILHAQVPLCYFSGPVPIHHPQTLSDPSSLPFPASNQGMNQIHV